MLTQSMSEYTYYLFFFKLRNLIFLLINPSGLDHGSWRFPLNFCVVFVWGIDSPLEGVHVPLIFEDGPGKKKLSN